MGRSQGRKGTGRDPIAELVHDLLGGGNAPPTEGEQRQAGEGEHSGHGVYQGDPRDIPGGRPHMGNPPVKRQQGYAKPVEDPYRNAILAHGVLPDGNVMDRDPRLTGGQRTTRPKYQEIKPDQHPVPVYMVDGGNPDTIRVATYRHITCPASTSAEPARVCGRNPARVELRLLNEDTATNIRIGLLHEIITAGEGGVTGGALIPWATNSYTAIETQDELFAAGATGGGTPLLSIIEIYDAPRTDR